MRRAGLICEGLGIVASGRNVDAGSGLPIAAYGAGSGASAATERSSTQNVTDGSQSAELTLARFSAGNLARN